MKKTYSEKGWGGLPYVSTLNLPLRYIEKVGAIVDVEPFEFERRIVEELLRQRVPLFSEEVSFFRRALGLSYGRFGAALGLSSTGVMKWEKTPRKRLSPINEVAVRAFFMEKFEIPIPGTFSALRGADETPKSVIIRWDEPGPKKPRKKAA